MRKRTTSNNLQKMKQTITCYKIVSVKLKSNMQLQIFVRTFFLKKKIHQQKNSLVDSTPYEYQRVGWIQQIHPKEK